MSIIKEPVLFDGSKGEKHLFALFGRGADISCISPTYVADIKTPVRLGSARQLAIANEAHYIEVTEVMRLDFYIDGVLLSDEFLVIPGLSEEVIIGAATLQKWLIKLDFEHDKVIVNPRYAKLQLV